MLYVIVLVSVLLFGQGTANALSCAEPGGPREELASNGAAVYAEVRQIKRDIEQAGITGTKEYVKNVLLEVERSWNIEVDSQVIAAADYAWGYDYRKGDSYLIFLTKHQDRLLISPCSPTMELASVDYAVQLLGDGNQPVNQVNLGYRMWFMFDTDLDMQIAGAILLTAALVLFAGLIRLKRGKRGS
jgi:hypothetical protein